MKWIHTSDWHIGRSLTQYSLLEDQKYFLSQLVDFAVEIRADALLISGDIYNRAVPSAAAVELLDEVFSKLILKHHIKVFAIAGNHDSPERLGFGSQLMEKQGFYIAGTPCAQMQMMPLEKGGESVCVYMLPYFTPFQVRTLLEDERILTYNDAFAALMAYNRPFLDSSKMNILLAHGFFSRLSSRTPEDAIFSQSELSIGTLDMIDITPADCFDYVALGHLHAPQYAGGEFARYAGSPLKYSLSEANQKKSVFVIETGKKGELSVSTQTFAPLRDVREIHGSFDELICPPANAHTNDYVYANISGDSAILYAIQKLRNVYPNILGLSFVTRRTQLENEESSIQLVGRTVEELFAEFYAHVEGEALDAARSEIMHEVASASQEEPS